MSDEWDSYVNDPRTVCKYGSKCYQKNPEHHKTYKHPKEIQNNTKKNTEKRRERRFSPYSKDNKHSKKDTDETKIQTVQEPETGNSAINKYDNNSIIKTKHCEPLTYYDSTDHAVLKELFLVQMPVDFYKFFECLNTDDFIIKTLSSVNLELIGPYELLLGKLPKLEEKELYLAHWRFFYDPPEFQAVIKIKGKSEYHIGYFRDDPNSVPVFLGSNDSAKDCIIKPLADNIFGAVYLHLQNEKTSPFTAMAFKKLMSTIKKHAEELNYSLDPYDMKKRKQKTVANSFHRGGIIVPYDKKTQLGYRPLVETEAALRKLFEKLRTAQSETEKDAVLSELQPVITYASIAVDECDFGTGLEMGINLFCSGIKELESNVLSSICPVYNLLNREEFSKIIQAHIKYRRKGADVSLLNILEF